MKKGLIFLVTMAGLGVLVLAMTMPAYASPPPQVFFQTPTPGSDGRIVYVVKAGDSCLSISLLTGMEVNQLRRLNNLDEECLLQEGQQLLLGIAEEPTATPTLAAGQTPLAPTPTLPPGSGTICIMLFDDLNGNSLADTNENPIAGGEVSISNRSGDVSLGGTTTSERDPDTTDIIPLCFENVLEGDYNISVAAPEGYNPTTNTNYPLRLNAGDLTVVDFGAQLSSSGEPATPEQKGRSPLLAILGGLLILGGGGLGIYFVLISRKK
jgi:hypothetical protein